MKTNHSLFITVGGLFTALAVIFQSFPVFFPGIGMALSPFSTLPVAIAACKSNYTGILTYFSSAIFLIFISPQEAVIFLLATGPLGFILGAFYKNKVIKAILLSSAALFTGVNLLIHLVGLDAFGGLTPTSFNFMQFIFILLFSFIYSIIWFFIIRFFILIFKRIKLL